MSGITGVVVSGRAARTTRRAATIAATVAAANAAAISRGDDANWRARGAEKYRGDLSAARINERMLSEGFYASLDDAGLPRHVAPAYRPSSPTYSPCSPSFSPTSPSYRPRDGPEEQEQEQEEEVAAPIRWLHVGSDENYWDVVKREEERVLAMAAPEPPRAAPAADAPALAPSPAPIRQVSFGDACAAAAPAPRAAHLCGIRLEAFEEDYAEEARALRRTAKAEKARAETEARELKLERAVVATGARIRRVLAFPAVDQPMLMESNVCCLVYVVSCEPADAAACTLTDKIQFERRVGPHIDFRITDFQRVENKIKQQMRGFSVESFDVSVAQRAREFERAVPTTFYARCTDARAWPVPFPCPNATNTLDVLTSTPIPRDRDVVLVLEDGDAIPAWATVVNGPRALVIERGTPEDKEFTRESYELYCHELDGFLASYHFEVEQWQLARQYRAAAAPRA